MKATLILFALIGNFTALFAATHCETDTTKNKSVTVTAHVEKAPPLNIQVEGVRRYSLDGDTREDLLHPGNYMIVQIDPAALDSVKLHLKDYRLWFDGICFPNMEPLFINESEPGIVFKIERDTARTSPWQLMYTSPCYWRFSHDLNITLGTKTIEFKASKKPYRIHLDTTTRWIPWVFYPLFMLLLVLLVRYGKALLKDISWYTSNGVTIGYTRSNPTDATKGVININDIPYSLSRFQFLIWLIVVFFGILHIWIITDVLTSPTGSVLLLLGISSGTFYISKMLDKTPAAEIQIDPATVTAFIESDPKSQSLLHDMMSDGKSISLHRLQLVLFTVFLATYFVLEVIHNLIMPQFDQTMLTLMGISSATYAGIKTTEQ